MSLKQFGKLWGWKLCLVLYHRSLSSGNLLRFTESLERHQVCCTESIYCTVKIILTFCGYTNSTKLSQKNFCGKFIYCTMNVIRLWQYNNYCAGLLYKDRYLFYSGKTEDSGTAESLQESVSWNTNMEVVLCCLFFSLAAGYWRRLISFPCSHLKQQCCLTRLLFQLVCVLSLILCQMKSIVTMNNTKSSIITRVSSTCVETLI